MNEVEWRKRLDAMVRDYIRSPELEHYFSIRMTKPRAAIMVTQQSLFVRHRRECWAHVSANCPVLAIKQRILEHEYEEIIRDDFSEYGHLHLIIRQGKSVGLEPEEILDAEPLPETRAVLYAWSWMTSEMSWIEALAGMTITEWCNDDRLLGDEREVVAVERDVERADGDLDALDAGDLGRRRWRHRTGPDRRRVDLGRQLVPDLQGVLARRLRRGPDDAGAARRGTGWSPARGRASSRARSSRPRLIGQA